MSSRRVVSAGGGCVGPGIIDDGVDAPNTAAAIGGIDSTRLAETNRPRHGGVRKIEHVAMASQPSSKRQGVGCALADEGVTVSYKYRTVRVRGTELVGTVARKHGGAAEIYETSKDLSTSVVPVFFAATGEIRFFDRSVLEDVGAPAS
ncbi:hypothetical protein QF038_002408 [Pseudarthrobacter sp. W1I19]|uniref:hypothetical protein n=1 Tax=Pseudarthrobacter sp. W1I19 TaxID=3042288 RepID=UPI002781F395|nr:hypothetical protein [Pseudarthrobacter sp. W1I19]MDQ0923900.1 hypothetical protein [Pseudarthrobacter sp. W1I19]